MPNTTDNFISLIVSHVEGHGWVWEWHRDDEVMCTNNSAHKTILDAYQCAVRWAMNYGDDNLCLHVINHVGTRQ